MPAALSKWSTAVHAHALAAGTPMTPTEALRLFGNPPTRSSASTLLEIAARGGWYRRDVERVEGARGVVQRVRFIAIDKADMPSTRPKTAHSYFHGLKRCRSVFEFGTTL